MDVESIRDIPDDFELTDIQRPGATGVQTSLCAARTRGHARRLVLGVCLLCNRTIMIPSRVLLIKTKIQVWAPGSPSRDCLFEFGKGYGESDNRGYLSVLCIWTGLHTKSYARE